MYLKKTTRKKDNRTYLSIADGFHDPVKGHSRTKTVKSLGFLDQLEKQYDDPITHFKEVVKVMNEEKKNRFISIDMDLNEVIDSKMKRKNLGYAALSKIYHELSLHTFFYNYSRNTKAEYNLNNIMKLLVFMRVINPTSKRGTLEEKGRLFENTDFTLDDIYRSLNHISKLSESAQKWIYNRIPNRKTETVYYDLTNYYFEIDEQDELRRRGVSKEHRPDPIVQMGLFVDSDGIPMSYRLFPGNTNDCETMFPFLTQIKHSFNVGRVIVVADKGLNTSPNIIDNTLNRDGYVFSQKVRGANKELRDYVEAETGYEWIGDDYKIKSRIYPRIVYVTDMYGKEKQIRLDEKQVVFYSKAYDRKAKAEREAVVSKALDLVNCPSKYNKATSYGAAKYVKNLEYDPKTGEILVSKKQPIFDEQKLKEDEKWDGYYAIVTSELDKTDPEIIEIYRGLWKIEESFKVTKSDLEARPVFLSREDRINAHFLICFISLTILRLLQKRLGNEFSAHKISESLRKIECSHLKENIYLLDYYDDVTDAIKNHLSIDFTKKYLKLSDIKNILGDTKK